MFNITYILFYCIYQVYTRQLTNDVNAFLDGQDVFFCTNKCGRKYKSKTALYTHLKYECGVDPKFRCEVCQKSYKHKCTFKVHMLREHGMIY